MATDWTSQSVQRTCLFIAACIIIISLWVLNDDILQFDYQLVLPSLMLSNNTHLNPANLTTNTHTEIEPTKPAETIATESPALIAPDTAPAPPVDDTALSPYTTSTFDPADDFKQYLSQHPELQDRINKYGNDAVIYDNPMLDEQCRNALIYKEHIDIDRLLTNCTICNQQTYEHRDDIMWSRELLDALQRRSASYYQTESIRVPYYQVVNKNEFQINTDLTRTLPTYYMIAKCASSSIFTNLDSLFDKSVVKATVHKSFEIRHVGESTKVHTDCGFTFVRNPINRLIAGYYTINRKIFSYHQDFYNVSALAHEAWNNPDNPDKGWQFLSAFGEPQRFVAFVEEMLSNPYKFVLIDPMSHVTSILSKSFSVFYGSDIQFIGKMEFFDDHWAKLMAFCPWFGAHIGSDKEGHEKNLNKSYYAMWQYGKSSSKPGYNEVLGVNESRILPTAYYIIAENETLYNRLVNYYWQDMICFGFQPDWHLFKREVKELEIKTYQLTHHRRLTRRRRRRRR